VRRNFGEWFAFKTTIFEAVLRGFQTASPKRGNHLNLNLNLNQIHDGSHRQAYPFDSQKERSTEVVAVVVVVGERRLAAH
jgi:hypothetical protein